jgi:exoribonuclease R
LRSSASGADLLLHYAIADVAWFVDDGGAIDAEAWRRGTTFYLPDGKAGLYPRDAERRRRQPAARRPRPAVIFTVRVAPDGAVKLDGAERALIRSRAKLAYDSVRDATCRPASPSSPPGSSGRGPPRRRPGRSARAGSRRSARRRLRTHASPAPRIGRSQRLAVARVQPGGRGHAARAHQDRPVPRDGRARRKRPSRACATPPRAFGLDLAGRPSPWPSSSADARSAADPAQAAFMLAIRRAGQGASYSPIAPGVIPWHAAMAATYAHATAPLRRLADRYVVRATLAIANGRNLCRTMVTEAFTRLPEGHGPRRRAFGARSTAP